MRDEGLRSSCFSSLAVLCAQFGDDVPYVGGLDRGFAFRGQRVPFLNRQQGIFRAAAQRGPAALSIQTSVNGPYDDRETPDGMLYAYRGTDPSHRDNAQPISVPRRSRSGPTASGSPRGSSAFLALGVSYARSLKLTAPSASPRISTYGCRSGFSKR